MVRVLDRKLFRELRHSAGMLLAVTSIISVGVACMVALGSSYYNLSEAKQLYYAQCQMADFSVEVKKFPVSELRELEQSPEVAALRSRIQFPVAVDLQDVVEPLNGLVLSLPDVHKPILNDIVLTEGDYFSNRRENEVIVSDAFARHHQIHSGQWIRLLLNNQEQELFVVGRAISSEFVYMLGGGSITPDPTRFGVFYVKETFAENVFDFNGSANQILGRLNRSAKANPRAFLDQVERKLESYGVFSTTPLEDQMSNKFLSQEIQGLESFAIVTPFMFLAVAALVLNVLLTRLVQQQRLVVGTLKALGYSDLEVFWHFLKFGLIVGILGGLLGCLLGWWFAGGLTTIYRQFFQFPDFQNRFQTRIYLIGMGISILCAVVGCIHGSRAVLKLNPAEAMRPSLPRIGHTILLERVGWFWRSLSSGWRIVFRNLFRSRFRSLAGIFAAAMGASVLVNGFMMQISPSYFIDFQFRKIAHYDYALTFKDERNRESVEEIAHLTGVDYVEPVLNVSCTFSNGPYEKKGGITGLSKNARLTTPRDKQELVLSIPDYGLAMSRQLAERLHVGLGDYVVVEPIKGRKERKRVPVVQISESYFGTMVYADIGYLSRMIGEEYALTGVELLLDQKPGHRDQFFREVKQIPALQSIVGRKDMVRTLEETILENQSIMIQMLVLFAGIVFFGSIVNASLVSLAERQREVATLQVLGYSAWQIGHLLFRESMITTLVGTLLGMPLGYLLTVITIEAYASEMFRLPILSPPAVWAGTLFFAVLFACISQLAVQRSINRMNWLDEALQVKE